MKRPLELFHIVDLNDPAAIDWPELPEGAIILYEHADPACPQRLFIAPDRGGFQISIAGKLGAVGAPPLTVKDVIKIAGRMIETVFEGEE